MAVSCGPMPAYGGRHKARDLRGNPDHFSAPPGGTSTAPGTATTVQTAPMEYQPAAPACAPRAGGPLGRLLQNRPGNGQCSRPRRGSWWAGLLGHAVWAAACSPALGRPVGSICGMIPGRFGLILHRWGGLAICPCHGGSGPQRPAFRLCRAKPPGALPWVPVRQPAFVAEKRGTGFRNWSGFLHAPLEIDPGRSITEAFERGCSARSRQRGRTRTLQTALPLATPAEMVSYLPPGISGISGLKKPSQQGFRDVQAAAGRSRAEAWRRGRLPD